MCDLHDRKTGRSPSKFRGSDITSCVKAVVVCGNRKQVTYRDGLRGLVFIELFLFNVENFMNGIIAWSARSNPVHPLTFHPPPHLCVCGKGVGVLAAVSRLSRQQSGDLVDFGVAEIFSGKLGLVAELLLDPKVQGSKTNGLLICQARRYCIERTGSAHLISWLYLARRSDLQGAPVLI